MPTTYDREFDFTGFQTAAPASPIPASHLDAELNRVKISVDSVIESLGLIQRDDGDLANGSVGLDQLATEVTIGVNPALPWVTATAYTTSDYVFQSQKFYRCLVSHTSGTFATDLAAVKWLLLADFSVSASAATTSVAGIVELATDAEAIAKADTGRALTPSNFAALGASDTFAGLIELATDAETLGFAITDRAITPANLGALFGDAVNVRAHGAVGDGSTDDTIAIQAAMDAAAAITSNSFYNTRPAVYFPAGAYLTGSLTASKRMAFVGDGSATTLLLLKSGVTTSLLILNAEDRGGTSVDDVDHYLISGLQLGGNRVDATTTGAAHGVFCPDPGWTLSTQYSPSVRMSDVLIQSFTGSGILLENNRNNAFLTGVVVRYCNDNGLTSYGYDSEFSHCSFGPCKNNGVREIAGGFNQYVACAIFSNGDAGFLQNTTADGASMFSSCVFNGGQKEGIKVNGAGAGGVIVVGCSFNSNSGALANTYSDINLASAARSVFVGNQHILSIQAVKYLCEHTGATAIVWNGISFTTGAYGTAMTNDKTKLFSSEAPNVVPIATVPNYADDAAAAIGGVPVGGDYRTASVRKIRVS